MEYQKDNIRGNKIENSKRNEIKNKNIEELKIHLWKSGTQLKMNLFIKTETDEKTGNKIEENNNKEKKHKRNEINVKTTSIGYIS